MPNPTVLATLARMGETADPIPTGEICRCPETQLDCVCGAYITQAV